MGRLILPGDAGFPVFGQQPDLSHPSLNGLIGWWPLNEGGGSTTLDMSASLRHGTLVNSPAWAVNGWGRALLLNGINQYMITQLPGPQACTVSALVNKNSSSNSIIVNSALNGTLQVSIGVTTNKLQLVKTNILVIAESTVPVPLGVPTHVAVTYNASGAFAFYINGILAGSGTNVQTLNAGPLCFGVHGNTGLYNAQFFNGALSDLRVYNRALSAAEILRLYYGLDNAEIFRDAYETAVWYDDAASTILTVLPAGIATGETFGTPALSFGGISVAPTGIASVEEFGTTTVSLGVISVAPTSIASEETFGTPVVTNDGVIISAEAIASAEAFGIATILPGGITLLPASIDSVGTVGTPTVSAGVQLSLTQADIDAIAEAVFARFQLTPSDVNVVTVRGHAVPSGISTLL